MKKFFLIISVLFCCISVSGCVFFGVFKANNQTEFDSRPIDTTNISSTENLVSVCKPAVVGITAQMGRNQSIGTGVCVKKGAYVLTNNHVVQNAYNINLYLSDGTKATAKTVWADPSSDLAMLKSSVDIPYLPIAPTGSYNSGDEVIAIGTPLDLAFKHSATKGIISAVNRTISVQDDLGGNNLYNLIQHDASINPGNSGGPLINIKGEVIGINTVKVSDAEGMGFAIPVETFKNAIEKVSTNGGYKTAYMGVFGYDNQLKNIGTVSNGFYIQDVAENSPAQKVGLQKGDIIKSINGQPVDVTSNLKSMLYASEVGDMVEVQAERDGKIYMFNLQLIEHPYGFTQQNILARNV